MCKAGATAVVLDGEMKEGLVLRKAKLPATL